MNVIGHSQNLEKLQSALQSSMRSFIFCGPDGVGKHQVARHVARMFNCQNVVDDLSKINKSCDCIFCSRFKHGYTEGIRDFQLSLKSQRAIDFIRTEILGRLGERVPDVRRYFVILNDYQWLSSRAEDLLLKPLEEIRETTFILITNQLEKARRTIKSRSIIFRFQTLSNSELFEIVTPPASFDEDVIQRVYTCAEGSAGKVQRYFDPKVISLYDSIAFPSRGEQKKFSDILKELREEESGELKYTKVSFILDMWKLFLFERVLEGIYDKKYFYAYEKKVKRLSQSINLLREDKGSWFVIDVFIRFWFLFLTSYAEKSSIN